MNKVVCYVCGASYPESATQCPICGHVQPAESYNSEKVGESSYTYVKGGRFSKANVKKRNKANAIPMQAADGKRKKPAKNSNIYSVILIIVLMLAIVSVAGYIALRFILPNNFIYEGFGDLKISVQKQETNDDISTVSTIPTEPEETIALDCTAVTLDVTVLQFNEANATHQLSVNVEPSDTWDAVAYLSSDETVVTVDSEGLVTAIGNGTAVITVTCGEVSAECTVTCEFEEKLILELNRKEITFSAEGEAWTLYSGEIPIEEIIWTSDDNSIAIIDKGKVTAVAEGDTIVTAVFDDQTVACVIHCKFEETQEQTSNIGEADGTSTKTYMLYNPYGYADDVTINIGDQFILKLIDSNMDDAENVEWAVKNEAICTFNDNTVTAVASGVTEVTVTCEGKTYTCVVRVN